MIQDRPAPVLPAASAAPVAEANPASEQHVLHLYISGQTVRSVAAINNLRRLCETHLSGRYRIEVIDLVENPAVAARDQILAIPTLVRQLPMPLRRVIGDLSNTEKVLVGLDLRVGSRPK